MGDDDVEPPQTPSMPSSQFRDLYHAYVDKNRINDVDELPGIRAMRY